MTPRRVVLTNGAQHDMRRLDRQVLARVLAGVQRFADTGAGDVRRLEGQAGQIAPFRLRVGDWRVWFDLDDDAGTLTVLRVRARGSAYGDL